MQDEKQKLIKRLFPDTNNRINLSVVDNQRNNCRWTYRPQRGWNKNKIGARQRKQDKSFIEREIQEIEDRKKIITTKSPELCSYLRNNPWKISEIKSSIFVKYLSKNKKINAELSKFQYNNAINMYKNINIDIESNNYIYSEYYKQLKSDYKNGGNIYHTSD